MRTVVVQVNDLELASQMAAMREWLDGHPAYSASKGAVRIYTKSAAVRYGPLGIRVPDVL